MGRGGGSDKYKAFDRDLSGCRGGIGGGPPGGAAKIGAPYVASPARLVRQLSLIVRISRTEPRRTVGRRRDARGIPLAKLPGENPPLLTCRACSRH
jgi:hypothetical protein